MRSTARTVRAEVDVKLWTKLQELFHTKAKIKVISAKHSEVPETFHHFFIFFLKNSTINFIYQKPDYENQSVQSHRINSTFTVGQVCYWNEPSQGLAISRYLFNQRIPLSLNVSLQTL